MTEQLRRSSSSGNGSSQNRRQGMAEAHDPTAAEVADSPKPQPDLVLDMQAIQILDSSDDCIKVLDLQGRILFMSRGGQVLLGIEDIAPWLNTSWIEFWHGADQHAAREAIAKARVGEVGTFQGYCLTPNREPKWWDCKVSPIRGMDGQVERLLCISRDITERKQLEDERKQAALNAEFLATVTQDLAEATCAEDIIQTIGEQLNRYLQTSICAFVEINESQEVAAIHHSWNQQDAPRLVGVYHLAEWVTDEFFQIAKAGQTIIVRDVTTDPRIADPEQFSRLKIGAFINVPLIREREWKFTLGIYHQTPYNWRSDEIELMRELANRIWAKLERTRVEIALRQSQEMFSALVADAPLGVYMIDAEFRLRQANQAATRTFNMQPLIGRDLAEALRSIWQEPFATEAIARFRHTLATGESYYSPPIVEPRVDIAEIQAYDWQLHRITLSDGSYGVVCYFYDLSEIKRAEEIIRRNGDRDAFLVTLSDALRPLNDPIEIQATANRVLGEHLQANRVAYFEVRGADYVVEQDYVNGVESLRGGYSIESFGTELLDAFCQGRTVAASDVVADPILSAAQKSVYAAVQNAAHIGVPLVKQGRFVAGLAVHSSSPRHWTPEEIALTEEVAERTWAAVERARAEAALRASEAKYRLLFQSIDQGYAVVEVLADENGEWNDFLFLDVNSAFEQQTGMVNPIGRKATDILGTPNPAWAKIYGQVAQTGEPIRFEQQEETLDRIFDLYAFRLGEAGSRRVAVIFTDITVRKRREANLALLAELAEAFSQLATAQDIIQIVGAKLGSYLNLATCHLVEIDEAADQSHIFEGWRVPEAPEVAGTYRISEFLTPEIHHALRSGETVAVNDTLNSSLVKADAYIPMGIRGFVAVPFHRFGEWKYLLSVTTLQVRHWQADEIELIQELSNRLFPRLERAQAEACLRESEERFRTVTATVPQLIWTATPDGRVDYLSDQWADYVGLSPEQLHGWNWQQVTHPEDLPNTVRDWQYALQSGEPLEIQHRFRHRTGEWRWQLVRGIPIQDATGNIKQWVGTCTDIQGEVDIKEALRKSEAKYRSLFDSIDEGFCIIEVLFDAAGNAFDYRFLEANAALEKHTGLVNVIGKTMRELVPQIEAYWSEMYGEIVLTGMPKRFENTSQEMGRYYDVYAFPMGEPQECKVAILFNDISDRKRAEQDLRESEEWARIAIQVARLGGWRLHLDTSLVEMDERMREIWGEPEDAVMVPLPQVLERMHPDDRERVANAVNAAIAPQSTGIYEIEYRLVWNDGTEHWVLAKGQAQFEGEGECRRTVDFFGTLLDITDRKQAEVEREQLLQREQSAREEAEQANRIKDEFLAVLSHELRSPLNPILGWSKLLQGGKLDPAKTTQALATIERNAKLQAELIEDLLDVSRILRGKLNLNVAPVDLAATVRGAMETVRLAAEAKSITVEATLARDVERVLGDSTRLQQVIWNLLSNAVKFTPEGGRVSIQLECFDSSAQITVSDTGQGIAPDFLPYVFDYFRQADGATTRKFGGLGLGLAIVRHLVELHGGTVRADSLGEGQGATFTLQLPLLHSPSQSNPDERSPQQSLDLSDIKILVVDDEPDTRDLVAFILEQQGAQVTTATSAHEALLLLPQAQPDVLLSDIGMPEMDGYMLIQQVRALAPDQGGQIPAIALTAYAGDTNQQQVIAAGFQKHISKPIEPEVLVQAIVHVIHPT